MPFDPNTLSQKFEDLFTKMDAQAAAQLAQTKFITNYTEDDYANLLDVWSGLNELRYLYRDPDDGFSLFYPVFKAHLAAIRTQLLSTLADPAISAADLLFSINSKLDGVINGNQALVDVMTDVSNQLVTANGTLASIWLALGTASGARGNILAVLSEQLQRAALCGCNSPNYEPQDCTDPWRSIGQASAEVIEGGDRLMLAVFNPATVPTGIEVTDDLVAGDRTLILADPGNYQMFVSSDAPNFYTDMQGTPEYLTNEWLEPPVGIESPFIVGVKLGSSLKVTFCRAGGFENQACIYQTGSHTDSEGRDVVEWTPAAGVTGPTNEHLDPTLYSRQWIKATGTDELSIVQDNGFHYEFASDTPFQLPFLTDLFGVVCNNGGSVTFARICPTPEEL